MPLAIVGVILLISGPAMIIAWLKLRKRNLSPVLNANGWAVNAQAYVNIKFGATLTKIAKFPHVKNANDPFKQGVPVWRKILYVVILLGIIFCALYFTNVLSRVGLPSPFHKDEPTEVVVADTVPQSDTTVLETPAEPAPEESAAE